MYKVKASILSDEDMIIEERAEIVVLDRIGFAPIIVKNGDIDIQVPNENSQLQIDVFGYKPKVMYAKEINQIGAVYLTEMIVIPTKPKTKNTLLYILGAIGVLGVFYYKSKKPTPRTVKIR